MRSSLALALSILSLGCAASGPPKRASDASSAAASAKSSKSAEAFPLDPGPSPLASVAPTQDGWYNAKPLLVSLRAGEGDTLARVAGLSRLEDLPLYDLNVDLDLAAGTFEVKEQVYFSHREASPLQDVVLRLHGNPVGSNKAPTIHLDGGTCIGWPCQVTHPAPSVVKVTLHRPLPAGINVRVELSLSGVLERVDPTQTGFFAQSIAGLAGLGAAPEDANYGLLSVSGGFVSLANFYAVLAPRTNGAWNVPTDAAIGDFGADELCHVRASVTVPAVVQVMTPGTTVRSALFANPNGGPPRRRVDIAAAMVRDFAVFAGEDVDVVTGRVGDVSVRSFVRGANREPGSKLTDVAAQALRIFERRFGPYPYTELDIVEAPLTGGAGGMEFSGLVAVASMLVRPFPDNDPFSGLLRMLSGSHTDSPVTDMLASTLEFTTAHEVAHQWWHGLVGSDSRTHPFVDESLAQYSTLLYLEDRYGADRARRDAESQVRLNYVGMRLMGEPDGAVDRPASSFTPIGYAGLVYGKGPFLYRALRTSLGDEAFFAGLREYATRYRFRTAPARGPVEVFSRGAQREKVLAIAKRWLDDKHGDQDLGPVDMKAMLATVLGADADKLAPQVEGLLELLGTGGAPSGQGGQGMTPGDAKRVLESLDKMIEGL